MERSFLTLKAFGHGGDFGYSGSAWYFPDKDMSIVVLNNDARKNSWQLAPAVQALLQTYLDCEATLSLPLVNNGFQVKVFPNPFTDEITLNCALPSAMGTIEWRLCNQWGLTVLRGHAPAFSGNSTTTKLNGVANLPRGLYYLECLVGGKTVDTQKILKSN